MRAAPAEVLLPADLSARLERGPALVPALLLLCTGALFAGAVLWAAVAETDRIVLASGRVEPAGKVRIVNHPTGGRVTAVHVREGDRVAAGDPLFALDPELQEAEHAKLADAWARAVAEVARLEAERDNRSFSPDPAIAAMHPAIVEAERALFDSRRAEHQSRRDMLVRQQEAKRNELRIREAELVTLRESQVLERQQLEAVRALTDRGLYPRLKLVDMEKQATDTAGRIRQAEAAVASARAALAEATSALDTFDRETRSRLLDELVQATARRDRLARELEAQSDIVDQLVIRAPVAGVVENLRVRSPGQSIAANQPLAEIVPVGEELVVEARVANEDIAEIRPGMPATVKVRAFDPFRYGGLTGTVQEVSADARPAAEGEPPSYRVIVATTTTRVGGPAGGEVLPGMLVDVEFQAGTRTVLDYLLEGLFAKRPPAFSEP